MPLRRFLSAASLAFLTVAAVAACTDGVGPDLPLRLQATAGNSQGALAGATLQTPLRVRIVKGTRPVAGVTVTWTVISGGGTVTPPTSLTDANGYAETTWQLGNQQGEQRVRASADGVQAIEFTAFAFAAAGCSGSPLSLQVGQVHVVSGAAAAALCVAGAPGGAEFVAVVHSADDDPTDTATVHYFGLSESVASIADAMRPSLSAGRASSASVPGWRLEGRPNTHDGGFHARLRARERALAPLVPAARAEYDARESSGLAPRAAIVDATPTVGETVTINAQSQSACSNAINRQGRIAAIGQRAIIVHDNQNPANGFTNAEYASIAATFDTLIHPVVTTNFGSPEDIDDNLKVIIFYTVEVNKLTERNSGSYVGGFYFVRDLFPRSATAGFEACPTSNEAEVFYMLAPDPSGQFGDARTKEFVRDVTLGTTAHEYQHLINASRRMFVNDADGFEETWLDEGLAHIAEELVFYASADLAPRMNIDLDVLRSSDDVLAAFNTFGISNFFRFEDFLQSPGTSSPYDADDNLASRGSAWHFLRYAADRRGGDEQPFWFALGNSTTSGMANIANALGTPPATWLRDWATAVHADDFVPGIAAVYTEPSWNMRDIFTANPPFAGTYPLAVAQLSEGTVGSQDLIGGGALYIRLFVSAGSSASYQFAVDGAAPPAHVSVTLVRTH